MGTKAVLAERCAATSREIEETRGRISAAKDVLRNRMKPQSLLNPVRSRLRETLGEGGEKILDAFRENPIPLALAGIGIGWLLLRDMRPAHSPAAEGGLDRMKETAGEAVEKTREVAGNVVERTREAAAKVRDVASAVPGRIKEGVRTTSDWVSSMMEENPMVVALGVLAVGMAVGLSFPASPKEEELAGKATEAALEKGSEILEKTDPGSSGIQSSKATTGLPEGSQSAE
jgi:ElaB/YqjD/DUF883 family membrane-anchored ribosome-binding protein